MKHSAPIIPLLFVRHANPGTAEGLVRYYLTTGIPHQTPMVLLKQPPYAPKHLPLDVVAYDVDYGGERTRAEKSVKTPNIGFYA